MIASTISMLPFLDTYALKANIDEWPSMPILNPILNPIFLPSRPYGLSELFQHRDRRVPIDTCIRNTDALFQGRGSFGGNFLVAFMDEGFNHDADDAGLAFT